MTTSRASQPSHIALTPASDEEIITGPNAQPSTSQFTPDGYLRQIEKHSEISARTSLYQGEHFASLAQLLKRGSGSPLSFDEADGFATFYRLQSDHESAFPAKLSLPVYPPSNGNLLLPSETGIIFLEGYPSARGLMELGAAYNIDPEFYQRHLRFPNRRLTKNDSFLLPVLPSFQSTILQMPVTTIGYHLTPQYRSVDEKRLRATGEMDDYLMCLRTGRYMGRNWEPRDSVVRSFAVHDEKEFSIQQMISICITRIAGSDDCWKGEGTKSTRNHWEILSNTHQVIVWLDAGKPLNSSPMGPWSSSASDIFLAPVALYKPGIALKDHRVPSRRSQVVDRNQLVQSLSLLPVAFGRSLHPKVLRQDPFYALSEIFEFVAVSESQFLTTIENQIDRRSGNLQDIFARPSQNAHANLLYFRNILEDHVNNIERTNGFIKTRYTLRWPRSNSDKAQAAALRIELDYEALLTRARHLRDRCERDIGVIINEAQLSQAKLETSKTKQIQKLTVLATIFLPIIATGTVFGMNFVKLGSASEGVWVWILATILLMMLSYGVIGWDTEIMRNVRRSK